MKIKGFTPVFDSLSHKYDPYTALVYGKIWRICDWSNNNVCTMANEKIADQLGLSEKTIRRKKEILEKDGLINVETKTGITDSVTVCHEVIMKMELDYSADSEGESVDCQSQSADGESYKDSTKIVKEDIFKDDTEEYFNNRPEHLVNKGETKGKRLTKAELTKASLGIGKKDKLEGVPPAHADLMRPFCEFYRYPFKDEVKTWIAQVDVWLGRKYTKRDVVNACKYVEANKGWEVYQPASILKAFGKKIADVKFDPVAERRKAEAKRVNQC